MPRFLATYDLETADPDPHDAFIENAAQAGWDTWILGHTNNWYKLPNTTLRGTFPNMKAARDALDFAANLTILDGFHVNLEKFIVVRYVESRFNSDKREKAQK